MRCPECPAPLGSPCGGERFRVLCHPTYRSLAPGLAGRGDATGVAASPPAPADDRALIAAIRTCPHRGPHLPPRRSCGCADLLTCLAGRGSLDGGATATGGDCLRCVRG